MLEDFPKEKLQEIYEILPEDLKEALFSQEISDTINDICAEENLREKQISKIIEYVGYVFLGLLSPNDFEKTLKEKLFLSEDLAHRINQRILRTIFLPLKTNLELIHKIKIESPSDIIEKEVLTKEEVIEEAPRKEAPPSIKQGKDIYREPINEAAEEATKETPKEKEPPIKKQKKDIYIGPTKEEVTKEEIPKEERPSIKRQGKDVYREPIE